MPKIETYSDVTNAKGSDLKSVWEVSTEESDIMLRQKYEEVLEKIETLEGEFARLRFLLRLYRFIFWVLVIALTVALMVVNALRV